MKEHPLNQINPELQSVHWARSLTLIALIVGVMAWLGDLGDLRLLAAGTGAGLLALLLVAKAWFCNRLSVVLRPVSSSMRQSEQERLALLKQALSETQGFPSRLAGLTAVLWAVTLSAFLGVLALSGRLTGWQVLMVSVLGISAAVIDSLNMYQVYQKNLATTVGLLADWSKSSQHTRTTVVRLVQRLNGWLLVLISMVFITCSLFWLDKIREQQAQRLLDSRQPMFLAVSEALAPMLEEKAADADSKAAFKKMLVAAADKLDAKGTLRRELLLLDARGDVISNTTGLDAPNWFTRALESGATSWKNLHAPFLFITKKLPSSGYQLMWISSMSTMYGSMVSMGWISFFGILLLLLMLVLFAWSLTGLALYPFGVLADRFKRLLQIQETDGDSSLGGSIGQLEEVISQFAASAQSMVKVGHETAENLKKDRDLLRQQIRQVIDSTDQRAQMAEQSAASVHEMRTSIQGISEQLESLREASSDCSSAMFEIDQSVREVAASSENLQVQVDDSVTSMSQVTTSMDQVSQNIMELAKTAEETVGSLSLMETSIKQVEVSTTETQRLSEEMSETASRGAESVRQTITGINEIQQVTDEARAVINRLGTQMEAVGKILTVISDVAEQTNLLALNAAIIAAAAGEHGKGFAVVADEIKDLADRTSSSTKEIAGLIKAVQSESRHAVDAMERGSGSVHRGVELANNAGEALQQILNSVRQASEMAMAIGKGTSEHTLLTRNISKSMSGISSMVREIRRVVSEQSRNGTKVSRVSEQMREDAKFVFRSANEQVQAAGNVARNMERISEMVSFISKAIAEQTQGVGHVAKVTEEVRDSTQQDKAQLADLAEATDRLDERAQTLLLGLDPLKHLIEADDE